MRFFTVEENRIVSRRSLNRIGKYAYERWWNVFLYCDDMYNGTGTDQFIRCLVEWRYFNGVIEAMTDIKVTDLL